MKRFKGRELWKKILQRIRNFLIFFTLIGFVVTCNFYLFFHSIEMSEAEIREAAPMTFLNVLLLTVLFAGIDEFRRLQMVKRPVRRIQEGLDKIMAGDFNV